MCSCSLAYAFCTVSLGGGSPDTTTTGGSTGEGINSNGGNKSTTGLILDVQANYPGVTRYSTGRPFSADVQYVPSTLGGSACRVGWALGARQSCACHHQMRGPCGFNVGPCHKFWWRLPRPGQSLPLFSRLFPWFNVPLTSPLMSAPSSRNTN